MKNQWTTFAELHTGGQPFILPNAWDVPSALILEDLGFSAIGTTSLGITATAGRLDGIGDSRSLTIELASSLTSCLHVPLTVDIEGGYSDDPREVAALATDLMARGVAGINLEDGRRGTELRSADDHAAIVEAVVRATPRLFVNARTDTYWIRSVGEGDRLRETARRLALYRDAGASGVFVPGLTDLAAARQLAPSIGLPMNLLWQPGIRAEKLGEAGVTRISTGSALYRHALGAFRDAATAARDGAAPLGIPVGYEPLQLLLRRVSRPGFSGDSEATRRR